MANILDFWLVGAAIIHRNGSHWSRILLVWDRDIYR
jgi:hypothetical protein